MTYTKPKNISYTEMCIYVDKKIQQDALTDDEASCCYEYLYHIIYMLAIKHKYFHKEEYYDEFAITLATDVYHRLFTHPKLKQLDENGKPLMPKMKSCLNYIKAILYGRKVAFEQKNYSQKYIDIEEIPSNKEPTYTSFLYSRDNLDFCISTNVELYLESITQTIKTHLYTTSPYKKQSLIIKNIYISCLLSILNSVTFTQQEKENIQNKYVTNNAKVRYLYKEYKTNKSNCVVLYHLPESYRGYIQVVVRQLFSLIGQDIKELCHEQHPLTEDILINISLSEIAGEDNYDD